MDGDLSNCKIIDFGLSIYDHSESRENSSNAGTLLFMPPEQVKGEKNFGKGADMWCMGLMIFKLLTNDHPFIKSVENIREQILDFQRLDFSEYPSISVEAQHLLNRMISKETSRRYSASEALRHPWITRRFEEPYPLTKAEKSLSLGITIQS